MPKRKWSILSRTTPGAQRQRLKRAQETDEQRRERLEANAQRMHNARAKKRAVDTSKETQKRGESKSKKMKVENETVNQN